MSLMPRPRSSLKTLSQNLPPSVCWIQIPSMSRVPSGKDLRTKKITHAGCKGCTWTGVNNGPGLTSSQVASDLMNITKSFLSVARKAMCTERNLDR